MRIAILSISLFLMSHLALAPAIPKLYALYHGENPNIGLASVESIITMPAMMITIFILLSNLVVTRIGKKKTVQLGLILILLSGIISFFTTNFTLVILCRLLLGIGIGLYNSLSISLISDYYDGLDRSSMIGYRNATLNIGKALTTFLVGLMALIGVRYAYLVYLLVIPVYLLFSKYVPEDKGRGLSSKGKAIFDKELLYLMAITFFVGISYIGATIKIPSLLVSKYHYSSFLASNILTVLAFSGILIGLVFGLLTKYFKEKTLLLMTLLMGIGNILFIFSQSPFLFIIGAILIGASFVGTMSSVFDYISRHYNKEENNFVTGLAIFAGNIGVIITPLVLTKVPAYFHFDLYISPFYITSGLILLNLILSQLLKKNKIN